MKYIQKGNPPASLRTYARIPGATYDDYPDKDNWSDVLLNEQGYLCAYTLKPIEKGRGKMKREHISSQNGTPENDLNHTNVVAVCMGNEGLPLKEQYADTRKGDSPLDPRLWPTSKDCERIIKYRPNGEIRIDDEELKAQAIDDELSGHLSLLNLNHSDLIRGRIAAYEAVKRLLGKGTWKRQAIEEMIQQYENRNANGRFFAYCMFVIYRLKKEMRWRVK